MLGWWITIISLPPEEADKLIGREATAPHPRRPPKLPHLWPPKLLHLAGVS